MTKVKGFAILFLVVLCGSIFAISDSLLEGKNKDIQKSKELEETEQIMDKKINELNKRLKVMLSLKDLKKIVYTPGQTTFSYKKGDDYILLTAYDFIPQGYSNKSIGLKEKKMKLYFKDDKLTKVESIIYEENFQRGEKFESIVIDPTPNTEGTEDIKIRTQFNGYETYEVELKDMENSISNPLRIKFKREYYIPHLNQFEKLYRFTAEYNRRYGTNNDIITIDTLKKSLDF